jgi:hypothetical protein
LSGKLLHSIAFTWKDSVTEDQIARLGALLGDVKGQLAGVERFEFGAGFGLAPGAMDFGLVIVFDDEPSFRAHVAHDTHVEVAALARSMAANLAGVQIAL